MTEKTLPLDKDLYNEDGSPKMYTKEFHDSIFLFQPAMSYTVGSRSGSKSPVTRVGPSRTVNGKIRKTYHGK